TLAIAAIAVAVAAQDIGEATSITNTDASAASGTDSSVAVDSSTASGESSSAAADALSDFFNTANTGSANVVIISNVGNSVGNIDTTIVDDGDNTSEDNDLKSSGASKVVGSIAAVALAAAALF
ncbi:hypothetical protein LPJ59_006997, partial [Coemansia sp. RSA 2399]